MVTREAVSQIHQSSMTVMIIDSSPLLQIHLNYSYWYKYIKFSDVDHFTLNGWGSRYLPFDHNDYTVSLVHLCLCCCIIYSTKIKILLISMSAFPADTSFAVQKLLVSPCTLNVVVTDSHGNYWLLRPFLHSFAGF